MIKRQINQVYNHFGYLIRRVVITGFDEAYVYCDLYCPKDIKRATGHRFPHGDEPFESLTQEEMDLFNPLEEDSTVEEETPLEKMIPTRMATVAQIRDYLEEQEIPIPKGTRKKADLLDLLPKLDEA